jgi:LPXTG-site transpeptidase (sortase) family protein
MKNDNWNVENENNNNERVVRYVRIGVSSLLAVSGVLILISQAIPLGDSYLKNRIIEHKEETLVSPVPGAYKRTIGDEFAYWDPGQSYFSNLIQKAGSIASSPNQIFDPETKEYRNIHVDVEYQQPMKLSIDSLNINSINIESNVASYSEDIYNQVLKNGLAHFRGTPLPDAGGNTFIYGHSAVRSFFDSHNPKPEIIFTKLEDISIGDEVIVNKDGVDYKYIVRKKKIVEPDDFSILEQQSSRETVTLMTCSPAGIASHRLIVIAERK